MMRRIIASLTALAMTAGVAACAHGAGAPASTASADVGVSVATPAGPPATRGTSAATPPATPAGSSVGASAFAGQGRLAFVSASTLYALDGSVPNQPATLHAIPASKRPAVTAPTTAPQAGQTPGSPAWSPDGRWLAYLVGPPSADGAVTSGALWLAGPDGQGAHQVLPKVAGFAWSPTSDELAATEADGGRLYAVRPGEPTYPMLEVPGRLDGAPAWSPTGRELAVASVELTATGRFASSSIDLFVPSEGIVVNSLASSGTAVLII